MSNTDLKQHPLFEKVEQAVFHHQVKGVGDAIRHLRQTTTARNFEPSVINELIHAVATQYKQ